MSKIIILMGVSGSGKSTIGKLLSKKIDIPFLDADEFHSSENIKKMESGIPLNDYDREPWLNTLNKKVQEAEGNKGIILACSALKETYRKILQKDLKKVHWFYLQGSFELIEDRIKQRENHFMDRDLLQSQFDCLEVPKYGIAVSIDKKTKVIVKEIITAISTAAFGVLGLGVMGKSLAINLLNNNTSLAVYNRDLEGEEGIVDRFLIENGEKEVVGFTNLEAFVNAIQKPRKILIMVKAGAVTDSVIEGILPYLEPDDILIDGGNSHYKDTEKREVTLKDKGIHFIGLGVSGGEEGALKGPSLMPGGNKESYLKIAKFLERIAAKDLKGTPCCNYIGPSGAGHFVKMVHNGIEYGDMQLLAELYDMLSKTMNYEEISELFTEWNKGKQGSYLLDITAKILKEKDSKGYVLDHILDKAGNKGTGSWSSIAALQLGIPTTLKTAAVNARYTSSFKEERKELSAYNKVKENKGKVDVDLLEQAYDFARTINLHQGLLLIKTASNEKEWSLDLAEICRVWSNGCIIKSEKIKEYSHILKDSETLIQEEKIVLELYKNEKAITKVIEYALEHRIQIPCFYEAYNYWIAMTTEKSSANLIQAQRDFFGAHRFQRVDADIKESFHHNWS